jgi:hypothetical protein
MIRLLTIIAFAATAGVANAAARLPAYEAGTAFIFDNGRVERVEKLDGQQVVWSARSGRTYVRSINPVVPILSWSFKGETGTRKILGTPDSLWPLRAGASVQFRTLNEARSQSGKVAKSVHLWTCKVKAKESVATPAGAFVAWPITCDRFSANSMKVLERLTWHFSEDVGHYVRREARDLRDGVSETFSLHTALPAWEANSVRVEAVARNAERRPKLDGGSR